MERLTETRGRSRGVGTNVERFAVRVHRFIFNSLAGVLETRYGFSGRFGDVHRRVLEDYGRVEERREGEIDWVE